MKQNKFPVGWDEERVKHLLAWYDDQTEEDAIAEDEGAFAEQPTPLKGFKPASN